jgi:hypothetical protein
MPERPMEPVVIVDPEPPAVVEEAVPSEPRRTTETAASNDVTGPDGDEVAVPPEAPARSEAAETTVPLPAGSQFNRPREDRQPVAPAAGTPPQLAPAPTSRPEVDAPVAAPRFDTETATAPRTGAPAVEAVGPPPEGEAPRLPAIVEAGAPRTFREVEIEPVPQDATEGPDEPVEDVAPLDASEAVVNPGAGPDVLERVEPVSGPMAGEGPDVRASVRPEEGQPARDRVAALTRPPDPDVAASPPPAPSREPVPAVIAHALPFENAAGLPLMSIVLIDEAAGGVSRGTLAGLAFPVAFAIDPSDPDAAEAAETYRASGNEVLIRASGLPRSVTPEVVAAAQAAVPGAVGVLDRVSEGLVDDPVALDALSKAGLGLVGLRAPALGVDLPTFPVYRAVDARGEQVPVITRFLDRATFEAEERGRTVVLGRTVPDTVTALRSWAAGERASAVAMAPISATLLSPDDRDSPSR